MGTVLIIEKLKAKEATAPSVEWEINLQVYKWIVLFTYVAKWTSCARRADYPKTEKVFWTNK